MVSNDDFGGKATNLCCFQLHINFEQNYPKPAIVRWSRKVHQRSEQDQTRVKSQSKDMNLGGLFTTFFIMFLAFFNATSINAMNTTPPKMLNQFPYNLRVCLVHGFLPVSGTFFVAAILFAQSKALRRAFIAFSRSMYQKSFQHKAV